MAKIINYAEESVKKQIDVYAHKEECSAAQTKLVVYAALALFDQNIREAQELLGMVELFSQENLEAADIVEEAEELTRAEVLLVKHFYDMKHDLEQAYDMTMMYNRHWIDYEGKLI